MNIEKILEQIFDVGYATKEIEVGKKLKVVIKSLSAKDYLEIDNVLTQSKGTKLFVLQKYGIAKLSRALISFNEKTFTTPADALAYLETLPAGLIDKFVKEHSTFEKEITQALSPESVNENFFDVTGSAENPAQLQKESTLGNQEV